jgi:DNA-binding beta-propeller fold protein YncE
VLNGVVGVALSPNGASVYVASEGGDAISHFGRAANGDLTAAGCISSASTSAANGCRSVGSEVLDGAVGLAVSPDGASVYVASNAGDAISHFRRAGNGDLTAAGCISSASRSAANGCRSVGSEVLDGATGVALSPNGASVYVASNGGDAISHFRRERPGGGGGGPGGTVKCNGVDATRIGTAGADVIKGTRARDVIVGLGGNDRLIGRRGKDLICGGGGKDVIKGGGGKDSLFGGGGRDRLIGGGARDLLRGGGGKDKEKQ